MRLPSWAHTAALAASGCSIYNGLRDQTRSSGWIPNVCPEASPVERNAYGGRATSTFFPILPPAIPLAVRSPYLSAWLATGSEGGNGGYLAGRWPQFWPIQFPGNPFGYKLGWAGLIRVDGVTYEFLGNPNEDDLGPGGGHQVFQRSFAFTSTQSIFSMVAGPVEFTVTFLSPISPGDLLRQSLPFSYLSVQITGSVDGLAHKVELYTDIEAGWASGDHDIEANWHVNSSSKLNWYDVHRKREMLFAEEHEYAEWGSAIYAAVNSSTSSAASGPAQEVRSYFVAHGSLHGKHDKHPRTISDRTPAFAHATPLYLSGPPAVFVIGHVRDPYVSYITTSGQQHRSAYWLSTFADAADALHFFFDDYPQAVKTSHEVDQQVQLDALRTGNQDHASIVSLSARQAMGTFEITMGKDSKGRWNESDVLAFMKEISSNGDMSTVDVIFPAFPILTYLDPPLLKYLLNPLFEYSESGLYPNKWTVHDIGRYPNATGHNDGNDEPMPVEEAGNMLIMVLAYYQVTNDKAWLSEHYDILLQWTRYLVSDGLIPAEQLSTDDFAGTLANQTDLAIKAIVGIGAMAEIAAQVGNKANASYYRHVAEEYVDKWIELAVSEDGSHTKLAYQDDASWGTLYNLYGDRLLNLGLVPHRIYDMQSTFYFTVKNEFGVPLDSRHTWSKTDWEMFAAATATSVSARDLFTGTIVRYLEENVVNAAFPDLFETKTANFPGRSDESTWRIEFINRPVSGGHFAILALDRADRANRVGDVRFPTEPGYVARAWNSLRAVVVDVWSSFADLFRWMFFFWH